MAVEVVSNTATPALKMGAGQMGVIVEWGKLTARYKGLVVVMVQGLGLIGLDGIHYWSDLDINGLDLGHKVELLPNGATLTYTEPAVKYAD